MPGWMRIPLEDVSGILTLLLAFIGVMAFILPSPDSLIYGVFSFGVCFLALVVIRYLKERRRKKALQQTSIASKTSTRLVKISEAVFSEDDIGVQRKPAKIELISRRTIALKDDIKEYLLRTIEGKTLHVVFNSDLPFSIYIVDKWHHDRFELNNSRFSEDNAIKGEAALSCLKTERWYLLLWNVDDNSYPRVDLEAWLD